MDIEYKFIHDSDNMAVCIGINGKTGNKAIKIFSFGSDNETITIEDIKSNELLELANSIINESKKSNSGRKGKT